MPIEESPTPAETDDAANLDRARSCVRQWAGGAQMSPDAVDRIAESVVVLWSLVDRAEEMSVYWMQSSDRLRTALSAAAPTLRAVGDRTVQRLCREAMPDEFPKRRR